MTEPTDAEIGALIDQFRWDTTEGRRDTARAVLAKWGTPAGAGAPVAPDFYTACAWYEGGGEAGWIPLPGYSNETALGVKHLVLEAARKEGYKGTVSGRLLELGWDVRPVYLAPQQEAPAGHTDGGRNMFYEGRFDGESEREQKARLCWADDMRAAFERHTGNGWFDKDWHRETALWAAAWRACQQPAPRPRKEAGNV